MSETTITGFDSSVCKLLSKRIEEALQPLAAELGVDIKYGGGSFSTNNFTLKVEVATIADNGTVMSADVEAFKLYAERFGLKPDDLGKQFEWNGKRLSIVGCNPRSRKYPILAEDLATKKRYKYPVDAVKAGLQNAV